MRRKKENSDYTEFIREIQQLNAAFQVRLSEIEEQRETVGPGGNEEMRLRIEAIDICNQLVEKSEGIEKDHWLGQIQKLEQELLTIDFSDPAEKRSSTIRWNDAEDDPQADDPK